MKPTDLTPPEYFDDDHRATWAKVCACIKRTVPATTVEAYCVELMRWRAAEAHLAEHGAVVTDRDGEGVARNVFAAPELKVARDSAAVVQKLSKSLGLTGNVA